MCITNSNYASNAINIILFLKTLRFGTITNRNGAMYNNHYLLFFNHYSPPKHQLFNRKNVIIPSAMFCMPKPIHYDNVKLKPQTYYSHDNSSERASSGKSEKENNWMCALIFDGGNVPTQTNCTWVRLRSPSRSTTVKTRPTNGIKWNESSAWIRYLIGIYIFFCVIGASSIWLSQHFFSSKGFDNNKSRVNVNERREKIE